MLNVSNNYIQSVYAPIRQLDSRITFTLTGNATVYDDTWITYLNVVEEMDTLSDTLPSNQMNVTLDNTSGEFNFLNLSNMQTIIASLPTVKVEMGLVVPKLTWDYLGSKYWSEV